MPSSVNVIERGSLFFRRIDSNGDNWVYISAIINGTQQNIPLDCNPNTVHWFCAVADPTLANNTFYFRLNMADVTEDGRIAKDAVDTISIANENVLGTGYIGRVINGVTLAIGSSILLTAQTQAVENGVYVVNSGSKIERRPDCARGINGNGFLIPVLGGTYLGDVYTIYNNLVPTSKFALFGINKINVDLYLTTGNGSLNLDNSTIYLNGSSLVAIKPRGITDNLVALDSGIVKAYDGTQTYNLGALVSYNGGIYRAIGTTTGGPARYTNNWCEIAEPGSGFGFNDVTIKSDADYSLLVSDYIIYLFINSTDRTITLPRISTMTGAHVSNRAKQYIIVKYGFTNTCNVVTHSADSFDDGSKTVALTDNGSVLKLMTIAGNGNTWVRL